VDYVSSHSDAFEKYKSIKLEGAEIGLQGEDGQKLSTYKRSKHTVCMELMAAAKEWASEQ
jgi:hypothetical protein